MEQQTDLKALGRYIREQRKELNLTQVMLGNRLGWAQERVSILENGKYGLPSLPQLCRLADALGVPMEDLVRQAGMGAQQRSPSQGGAAPDRKKIGELREQMASLHDQVQVVEGRLHQAERELGAVEALHGSIRERSDRMATLLAACREK